MAKNITYVEPIDYFPKELRKQFGIGEFEKPEKKTEKKKTEKKKKER